MYSNLFYDTVHEVRSVLWAASFGAQGREKWMIISDMGYHIVFKYGVILVSLPMKLNITFFSLLIAPRIALSRHKIIAINFVDNNQ